MKEYRIKLKHDFTEALAQIIKQVILKWKPEDDNDRLLLAALEEVRVRLEKKLVVYRQQYLTTLTPVQAIALRMIYSESIVNFQTLNKDTANKMRMIAAEIHQHYS